MAEVPHVPEAIREYWRTSKLNLHDELLKRDPEAAARLEPNDRQRLTRALEVFEGTGRSLLAWQRDGEAASPLRTAKVERLFLDLDRQELYARAERRFDLMIVAGALEEVKALPDLPPASPLLKAIGVPELQAHLRGEMTVEQAVIGAKTATRHYIKRQLTWWRPSLAAWTRVEG
jgi:tRNA dimethylallyltransferase